MKHTPFKALDFNIIYKIGQPHGRVVFVSAFLMAEREYPSQSEHRNPVRVQLLKLGLDLVLVTGHNEQVVLSVFTAR